jgi:ribosomal protein L29
MKYKEITKMSNEDRERKLNDLKIELLKSRTKSSKTGSSNTKEIKKTIAKILTFNTSKGGIGKK